MRTLALAIGFTLAATSAWAACTNPIPAADKNSATVNLEAQTGPGGNCVPESVLVQGGALVSTSNALYVQPGSGASFSVTLPASATVIGKVGIDQTTPGTTNAVSATNFPTTVDTNSGNKSANTLRMVLATDQPALTNAQPGNFTQIGGTTVDSNTGAPSAGSQRVVIGSGTAYFLQPTASDNHANIKNGAGVVYGITVTNNSATLNYLRLYNAASGFNGCNSATNLITQVAIPASTSGAGITTTFPAPIAFSSGVSICVTSGYATTDTTNATASAMSVTVVYN